MSCKDRFRGHVRRIAVVGVAGPGVFRLGGGGAGHAHGAGRYCRDAGDHCRRQKLGHRGWNAVNGLCFFWNQYGTDTWQRETVAGPGTTFSSPAIAQDGNTVIIAAQGAGNSLDFYWHQIGTSTWHQETVAGVRTTFSAPSMTVKAGAVNTVALLPCGRANRRVQPIADAVGVEPGRLPRACRMGRSAAVRILVSEAVAVERTRCHHD